MSRTRNATLRNIFDQYETLENRLTHALTCCLAEDEALMRRFIQWVTGVAPPRGSPLQIVQQQVPGAPVRELEDGEGKGLPDAWLHTDDGWSLLVESKVAARLRNEQLLRHLRIAERNGFTRIHLLVLTATSCGPMPARCVHRRWSEPYQWALGEADRSRWAERLADYLEDAERRMIARGHLTEGQLTVFSGFRFGDSHPYTYREGKRLLKLALEELRQRAGLARLGVDLAGDGRSAITGTGANAVWDFLPLQVANGSSAFVKHPHLTLSLTRDTVGAFVTLPNQARADYRRPFIELGPDGFREVLARVARGMRSVLRKAPGAAPRLELYHRRYPSQRAPAIIDARVECDLRTAVPTQDTRIIVQPQWVDAAYDAVVRKKANLQISVGARFPYGTPSVASTKALDLIEETWVACRPFLEAVGGVRRQ